MQMYCVVNVAYYSPLDQAVQMWVLGRFLPVLVGDHVPEGDENWTTFLKLLKIMDFLVAPEISVDELAYLKILIEEHHSSFVALYPHVSVPPKFHYLIHLARLIAK